MYIVYWTGHRNSSTLDWFSDDGTSCPWTNDKKRAALYNTPEEAYRAVKKETWGWEHRIEIQYIHPLNIK
jgi:hypothetical protein